MSGMGPATPLRTAVTRLQNEEVQMSPRRRSLVTSTPMVHSVINDDEAERARRRSSVVFQKRVSHIGVSSDSGAENDSRNISDTSLQDHYQTCMKLFMENKINAKNVWNLRIIDYIKRTFGQGNLQSTDTLQTASVSLDICSKVYGLRVDDIHSRIFKLASTMAQMHANQDAGENSDTAMDVDDEEGQKKQEKKKERRKRFQNLDDDNNCITVAADESALNGKIIPHNTVVNSIGMKNDRFYTFSMFNKLRWGFEQLIANRCDFPNSNQEAGKEPEKKEFEITIPDVSNMSICPPFNDFVINKWNPEDEEQSLEISLTQSQNVGGNVVFDEDGIPVPELDASVHDFNDMGSDKEEEEVMAHGQTRNHEVAYITDMRPGDGPALERPLHYSYRSAPVVNERYAITGVWAGPSHWKLKCLQRRTCGDNSNRDLANGNSAPRRGRRLQRLGPLPINYMQSPIQIKEPTEREKQRIKRRVTGHVLDKYTLPEDMGITANVCYTTMLRGTFHRPSVNHSADSSQDQRKELDLTINNYQYDNPNDSNYCAQNFHGNDEDDDDHREEAGDAEDDLGNIWQRETFIDDNLVEQPNIVPNTYVPYATRANRMDMRKLKESIWRNIAGESSAEEEVHIENNSLKKMFVEVPGMLPSNMAEEFSVPLAFVATLHLANEKQLQLLKGMETGEVVISLADKKRILNNC